MALRIVSPDGHQARLSARRLSLNCVVLGAYRTLASAFRELERLQLFPLEANYLPSSYSVNLIFDDEGFGLRSYGYVGDPNCPSKEKLLLILMPQIPQYSSWTLR